MKNNIAIFNLSNDIIMNIDKSKYNVTEFNDLNELKRSIKNCELVIIDLENKFNKKIFFNELKEINNNIKILAITDFKKVRIAIKLLKDNLTDFLIKDKNENILLINDKIQKLLKNDNEKQTEIIPIEELLHSDKKIKNTLDTLSRIANTVIPILIQGEHGTEQELYANLIHNMSDRKNNPFLTVFCPSLTKENLEKTLYGDAESIGKLEKCKNGTVFLENIEMLDYNLQSILIRLLDQKEIEGLNNKDFNIRIISSSNKNLEEEVKQGNFREELYYMINTYSMNISPLREMRIIIPLLVKNLYQYFALKENKKIKGITNKALKILENYNWPGNIKEIKSVIYKAVILNKNGILTEEDFPTLVSNKNINIVASENHNISLLNNEGQFKNMELLEKEIIDKYLKLFNGNISETSKILNVGRATLYRKLQQNNDEKDI